MQPPAEWAACDGLKGIEKVCPDSHLSMYIRVSVFFFFFFFFVRNYMMDLFYIYIGWPLGSDGTVEDFGGMSFHNCSEISSKQALHYCESPQVMRL